MVRICVPFLLLAFSICVLAGCSGNSLPTAPATNVKMSPPPPNKFGAPAASKGVGTVQD